MTITVLFLLLQSQGQLTCEDSDQFDHIYYSTFYFYYEIIN